MTIGTFQWDLPESSVSESAPVEEATGGALSRVGQLRDHSSVQSGGALSRVGQLRDSALISGSSTGGSSGTGSLGGSTPTSSSVGQLASIDRFDSEPNNVRGQADFIAQFGGGDHSRTFYGHTGSGSDRQDWYRFRLDGTTSGSINLTGMRQDMDIALYNASGSRVSRSVRPGTATDSIRLNNLPAGDYYIKVYPGVRNARSAYALRFNLNVAGESGTGGSGSDSGSSDGSTSTGGSNGPSSATDRFDSEPNNARSQADYIAQFGGGDHRRTFYGHTGSGSDSQDWYRFRLDGTTSGSINLTGMTQDMDVVLYNASGSRVAQSVRSGTATDSIRLNNLPAGDYFIKVYPGVRNARSAYALRFNLNVAGTSDSTGGRPDPGSSGGQTPSIDRFDSEPNNARSQADFIAQFNRGNHSRTFYGNTGSGSDSQDWYRFRLDGSTRGSINLSGMFQDMDIALYNASGSRVSRSARSGTATDSIRLNNLPAGDYFIKVYPGVRNARSAYALRFNLSVT